MQYVSHCYCNQYYVFLWYCRPSKYSIREEHCGNVCCFIEPINSSLVNVTMIETSYFLQHRFFVMKGISCNVGQNPTAVCEASLRVEKYPIGMRNIGPVEKVPER